MDSTVRNWASLAPIIVALLLIASISALGLVVALWPWETPVPPPSPTRVDMAPPDRHEVARDSLVLPPGKGPRLKWT